MGRTFSRIFKNRKKNAKNGRFAGFRGVWVVLRHFCFFRVIGRVFRRRLGRCLFRFRVPGQNK